jgi:hypothetical protein
MPSTTCARREQPQHAAQRVRQPLAAQAGEGDGVHGDAAGRHQLVFHAGGGAQPAHRPATALHFGGDGQAGDDVAAGAGSDDEEVFGAHG